MIGRGMGETRDRQLLELCEASGRSIWRTLEDVSVTNAQGFPLRHQPTGMPHFYGGKITQIAAYTTELVFSFESAEETTH